MHRPFKLIDGRVRLQYWAGFSLLELLVVVALIGILASYAVPTYQQYLQKTRFIEVIHAVRSVRLAQSLCLLQHAGTLQACDSHQELGIADHQATANTTNVSVQNATAIITGEASGAAGGHTYILEPSITDGQLSYTVSGSCIGAGFCESGANIN